MTHTDAMRLALAATLRARGIPGPPTGVGLYAVQGLYGDHERASLVWVEECGAEEMEGTEGTPLQWCAEILAGLVTRHAPLLPEMMEVLP